jgi:hypothetical protein
MVERVGFGISPVIIGLSEADDGADRDGDRNRDQNPEQGREKDGQRQGAPISPLQPIWRPVQELSWANEYPLTARGWAEMRLILLKREHRA